MDKFYLLPFVFLLFLERFFLLATLDTSSIGVFSIFAGIFLLSFLVRECWQDAMFPYISKYLPDWKQVRKILGMGSWVYGVTACCICVLGICWESVSFRYCPCFSRTFQITVGYICFLSSEVQYCFAFLPDILEELQNKSFENWVSCPVFSFKKFKFVYI